MATDRTISRRAPGPDPLSPGADDPLAGRRFSGLDGLRGLAVLFVLVFHIVQVEAEPASGLPRLAYKATRIGQTGVDLFFVLSGFLITGILHDTKGSAHYFRNFYGRRTLRIFPLYYGVLIAATVVLPAILGHRVTDANPWTLWTYTANLPGTFGTEPRTFGHFWTLAVEEQFYLLWPAVVLAFARPALMRVCVACIVGSIFVRVGLVGLGLSPNSFLFGRLDSLALGGWLALVARGPEGMAGWRPRALMAVALMGVAVAPVYVMKTGSHEAWLQVIKYTLLAGLYGAVLVLAVVSAPTTSIGRFFDATALRFFGKYSYGIYIFHPFFIDAFRGSSGGFAPRFAAIVALSIAAAWLSWHLFEKHFLGLKRLFEYERRPSDDPEPRPIGGRLLGIEG